jgi:exodeoxyribonuclease VII large subunit
LQHVYFEIIDGDYAISCFLRNSIRHTLDFSIEKGMKLDIIGSIRVYDKEATIQIEVSTVNLVERSSRRKPAELEALLKQQGLWRTQKHPLPRRIKKIAVVTSENSEAYEDFRDTFIKQKGKGDIFLADIPLQGEQAPQMIADAIKIMADHSDSDVIVLTRGGGRDEELGLFNELVIAKAIFHSKKFVLTGIGHKSDETLADRAADHAESTPSTAAVYLTNHQARIRRQEATLAISLLIGLAVIATFLVIAVLSQG